MSILITILGWTTLILITMFVILPFLFRFLKSTIYRKNFDRIYLQDLLIDHKLPEKMYTNEVFLNEIIKGADVLSKSPAAKGMYPHCRTTNDIFKEVIYGDVVGIKALFDESSGIERDFRGISWSKSMLNIIYKHGLISEEEYKFLAMKVN